MQEAALSSHGDRFNLAPMAEAWEAARAWSALCFEPVASWDGCRLVTMAMRACDIIPGGNVSPRTNEWLRQTAEPPVLASSTETWTPALTPSWDSHVRCSGLGLGGFLNLRSQGTSSAAPTGDV